MLSFIREEGGSLCLGKQVEGDGGNARWVRVRTVSNERGPEARPDRDQNPAGLVQCQWFDCSLLLYILHQI